eukprot:249651_1
MMTQQKKELLVSGYTRLNFKGTVPYELIIMFGHWLNNTLYINFSGDSLQKLVSRNHPKNIHTIQFTNNISMDCIIHPNIDDYESKDTERDHKESDQILLEVIPKAPPNVNVLNFYIECGCEEIFTSLSKQTSRHSFNTQLPVVTHYHTITSISNCKTKDKLTFFIVIELISIQEQSEPKTYLIESPIYKSPIEYKWIVTHEILQQFKSCQLGDFVYSPNFGNGCISFFLTPKGWMNERNLRFGIEFYKLPNKIDFIKVSAELKTNINCGDLMNCKLSEDIERGNAIFFFWGCSALTADAILSTQNDETLEFTVKIIVADAFINDKSINKSEWYKYNMIENVEDDS